MNDPLHDYLKKNKPVVSPVPADEWQRIVARTRAHTKSKSNPVWYYVSAATLAAAGFMAFLKFTPQASEPDALLEAEDLIYQVEASDRGAYQDWLWIADQVAEAAHGSEGKPN